MPVILALRWLTQKDSNFTASLDHKANFKLGWTLEKNPIPPKSNKNKGQGNLKAHYQLIELILMSSLE